MDLDEFNDSYLRLLIDKVPKENKSFVVLGNFNVDLLKYDYHVPNNSKKILFSTIFQKTGKMI